MSKANNGREKAVGIEKRVFLSILNEISTKKSSVLARRSCVVYKNIHNNTIQYCKSNNGKTDYDYERCRETGFEWHARERENDEEECILEPTVLRVLSSGRRYTML